VKVGTRNFPLPSHLWGNYTIAHFKTQLAGALPATTPGAEVKGESVSDDTKISSIAPTTAEQPGNAFLVFNVDKSAPTASGDAAPIQRTTSMAGPVKAGSGPITGDRELATEVSIYLDSATVYCTATAKNATQGINFEGKWSASESNFNSATLKEFKSKLAGFPKTSDRGTLTSSSGSKNVKDSDKFGALGVKGKKGDTLKFNFTFELGPIGGAAGAAAAVAAPSPLGEPAPEIDAKHLYTLTLSVSLMEGSVFLTLSGSGDPNREGGALPEAKKTAALPKVTFSVFKLGELIKILKGGNWPVFQDGLVVFERPTSKDKVKVSESLPLEKLGIVCPAQGSNTYTFHFAIDPAAPLPSH